MKRPSHLCRVPVAWALALASVAPTVGCRRAAPETPAAEAGERAAWTPPAGVQTVLAEAAVAAAAHPAAGRIEASEDRTQHLGAPVDGRVIRVRARLGEHVHRGQSLLTLRSPQVAALHAEVRKARHDQDLASREVARLAAMHGDGATSDRELAAARSEQAKAQAELEHGQAAIANLGLDPARHGLEVELLARVAGTVVDRQVLVGQEVRADGEARLMTISDLAVVWAVAEVFEADLAQVAVGQQAVVRVPAYPLEHFTGEVIHVGEVVDPTSRTVRVRCQLANPDGRLKPQMSAQVEFVGDQALASGVWLPASAVLLAGDRAHAYVVGPHGPERRQLMLGRSRSGRQWVTSGVAAGERVVAEGALFLDRAQSR